MHPFHERYGQQGVSTELKEVIVAANPIQLQ
jgi:hypothetical protein